MCVFWLNYFNPRAPCGARPHSAPPAREPVISIHVPHAGHDRGLSGCRPINDISIHVPHAGHDIKWDPDTHKMDISIHVPHAGHDLSIDGYFVLMIFQSTCPMRGTTRNSQLTHAQEDFNPRAPCGARHHFLNGLFAQLYFNPRAPCGARLSCGSVDQLVIVISIHVPHAGHDI